MWSLPDKNKEQYPDSKEFHKIIAVSYTEDEMNDLRKIICFTPLKKNNTDDKPYDQESNE